MSVRFWRSAGHFGASYKCISREICTLYRPSTDGLIPCLAQKSRSLISHTHLLFYMIHIKNKLFYIFYKKTRSLIFHIHRSRNNERGGVGRNSFV